MGLKCNIYWRKIEKELATKMDGLRSLLGFQEGKNRRRMNVNQIFMDYVEYRKLVLYGHAIEMK